MFRVPTMTTTLYPCLVVSAALLSGFSLYGQVPASWQSRGVGGGGALYSPSINPINDNEYFVPTDMSELFHTTDFGNTYTQVDSAQIQAGHESGMRFTNNPLIAYRSEKRRVGKEC